MPGEYVAAALSALLRAGDNAGRGVAHVHEIIAALDGKRELARYKRQEHIRNAPIACVARADYPRWEHHGGVESF